MARGEPAPVPAAELAGWLALALAFVFLTLELNTFLSQFVPALRAGGISILWSLFALGLIVAGIHKNAGALRFTGLGLFTVVGFKVFFSDLASLDQFYRIIAFILLGVLILCGAFLYLKYRQTFASGTATQRPRSHAMTTRFAVICLFGLSLAAGPQAMSRACDSAKSIDLGQATGEEILAVVLDSDIYAATRDGYPDLRIVDDRGATVPTCSSRSARSGQPRSGSPAPARSYRCTWMKGKAWRSWSSSTKRPQRQRGDDPNPAGRL